MLYEALGRIALSAVVELNLPVSMAKGPANALLFVGRLALVIVLRTSQLLPTVCGELRDRVDRTEEAGSGSIAAAGLAANCREGAVLLAKDEALWRNSLPIR